LGSIIEAKGLGQNLDDRRWKSQVLSYATVAGVAWCVLTDGNEYGIYNATAREDVDRKLFRKVRITEDDLEEVAETLGLLSRDNMEEIRLDREWKTHYIDRQVRAAFREILIGPNKRLISLIRSHTEGLSPKDVAESIRRLPIRIDDRTPATTVKEVSHGAAASTDTGLTSDKHTKMQEAGRKAAETRATATYTFEQHTDGKPGRIVGMARTVDKFVMGLDPSIERSPKKMYVGYKMSKKNIVSMEVQKSKILLCLRLDPKKVSGLPEITRDVSKIGHYGTGDLEISLSSEDDIETAKPFIRMAYEKIGR
jgi:predicted transport protein